LDLPGLSLVSDSVQLLVIGGSAEFGAQLDGLVRAGTHRLVHVPGSEWRSPSWQEKREPGAAWAVVALDLDEGAEFEDLLQCTQLVTVAFRPTRVVVMLRHFQLERILSLMRAGADGLLPAGATPEQLIHELEGRGVKRDYYFPDPTRWLQTLVRAAGEIDLVTEDLIQFRKLLRVFISQMGVDRGSILLAEGNQLRLAASVGSASDALDNKLLDVKPGSITDWVIQHGRSRLMIGDQPGSRSLTGKVETSICAPIVSQGEVLGTVNFASANRRRELSPADLATTEVFASLLAMAISNQRLVKKNVEAERLAAIGSTLSTLSHCIKNLLTVFKGSTMILEKGLEKQDFGQIATSSRLIGNGVRRLENLVLDLLDLSKKRAPEPEEVLLEDLLGDIAGEAEAAAQQKRHAFEVLCDVEGRYLLDRYRLHRALMNLISNARDAVAQDGLVRLEITDLGNELEFAVSDNGPGVPEENLATIFDQFYSTKGSVGTGLGLAMVAKFAEENSGSAEATIDSNLGGLRVAIRVPGKPA